MKNYFTQYGMKAAVFLGVFGVAEFVLLAISFFSKDDQGSTQATIYVLVPVIALLVAFVFLFLPEMRTRVYVDEESIVGKSLGKECWRCTWQEINQLRAGYYTSVSYIIRYGNAENEKECVIEITPSSRKILAHYCTNEELRGVISRARMYISKYNGEWNKQSHQI
jgi:hypothetical protein